MPWAWVSGRRGYRVKSGYQTDRLGYHALLMRIAESLLKVEGRPQRLVLIWGLRLQVQPIAM